MTLITSPSVGTNRSHPVDTHQQGAQRQKRSLEVGAGCNKQQTTESATPLEPIQPRCWRKRDWGHIRPQLQDMNWCEHEFGWHVEDVTAEAHYTVTYGVLVAGSIPSCDVTSLP